MSTYDLCKSYGDKEVLSDVNLRIAEGEFYCLMGPNGSGKSTLLSILASVRRPTSGRAELYGRPPECSKETIGYIPQENFTSTHLTGRENLRYFAGILGYGGAEARRIVDSALEKTGLLEDADRRVSQYSGGMRKRLEVATALFPGIRVMLLDEPTTGLDPSARRSFLGLIQDVKAENVTIVMVTHMGSDAELADRVGMIDSGRVVAEGTPQDLKANSGTSSVLEVEVAAKTQRGLEALRRLVGEGAVETDNGYKILSDDVEVLIPKVNRELDDAGCKVLEVRAKRPSLEDVFFELTGRAVSEG